VKYRHAFHAGNFADVHKHIMLLALVRALSRKDKGFLFLDTHAGRGFYDLSSSEAYRSHEADEGIERLCDVTAPAEGWPAELADYIALVETLRRERHDRAAYPGSPLLALLRPQDRTVLIETQPSEHAALREAVAALARYAPAAIAGVRRTVVDRVVIECADSYGRLRNWLPPIERRALVLIDPPYEDGSADQRAVEQALVTVLERLPSAVVALWYPIKDRRDTDSWLTRLQARLPKPPDASAVPALITELCLHPPDNRVGLNGSGMLVLNPPWQTDTEAARWLPVLHRVLDPSHRGSWSLR
jgi:23S rRNA (adenine2030-N6)-methyltransferase